MAMARVCEGAETHPSVKISKHRVDEDFGDIGETIAMAAVYAANHLSSIKAIVGLTESGTNPKLMSRITSSLPIYGLSRHVKTLNTMALYRGVTPIFFDSTKSAPGEMTKDVMNALKDNGVLEIGDQFILTYGDQMETIGATNACKVVTVF
jgi:pyruvate kinase